MHKLPIINIFLIGILASCALQRPDRSFDATVAKPAFTSAFPKVFYDEAHLNTHKATGTYKPFIDLITNDGYRVSVNRKVFSLESLGSYHLLVICNAKSDKHLPRDIGAFTTEECDVVNKWVENGGALLLIADHHPFGLANSFLARSFGVEMGCGSVKDPVKSDRKDRGQIEFNREGGLLNNHRITTGYNAGEEIDKVVTFTGQSLSGSPDMKSLLTFSDRATEIRPDSVWSEEGKNYVKFGVPRSAEGLSQAIAIEYGKGRVVILGEAAMLTAQKLFLRKFGMNYSKESDNKQLALNIMHWLTERRAF